MSPSNTTNDRAVIGPQEASHPDRLNITEAAQVLNADGKRRYGSERHLIRLVNEDLLPSVKIGRERFVLIEDLERVGVHVPAKVTPTFDELVAYAKRIAIGGRALTHAEVTQLSAVYNSLNEEAAA